MMMSQWRGVKEDKNEDELEVSGRKRCEEGGCEGEW